MKQAIMILAFTVLVSLLAAESLNIYTSQQNYDFDLSEIINLSFTEDELQVETFEMLYAFMFDEILYLDFDLSTQAGGNEVPVDFNFLLRQNYPNPFNPDTNISFELQQAGKVEILIYNSKGQKVRTLVDGSYTAGEHVVNWNGRSDRQEALPSGVYYYQMSAGKRYINKKMILLK